MTQTVTILGSTGSIGTQVLDVVERFPERFKVAGLSAGDNLELLATQIEKFRPASICVRCPERIAELRALLAQQKTPFSGDILSGDEGLRELAQRAESQTLIVGLVGMRGLAPTLAALEAGKRVLTANKETFVVGGHLMAPYLDRIIPIDSEHSAIHQCLKNEAPQSVQTIYLTASGGPFRKHSLAQLSQVKVEEALKHPNWVMGKKITIDSATLMNKGLEVIEAHWLFGVPYDRIQVVIHPTSVIHSGVAFVDGSVLTQLGVPDMHIPIQYAMTYPERLPAEYPAGRLNLFETGALEFEAPDPERFPCLALAYEAGRLGSSATTVLNAADEVAVELFLSGKIGFMEIPRLLAAVLTQHQANDALNPAPTLDEIFRLDAWARNRSLELALSERV